MSKRCIFSLQFDQAHFFCFSKSVLNDYAELTDLSTPAHCVIYKSIHDQVDTLSSTKEYQKFLEDNK